MPSAPFTLEQAEEAIADLRAQVDRMGEVHALDGSGGVVPNAQPGQAQLYTAADGQPAYVTPSGLVMGTMGAQQAFFPGNTATAATLTNLAQGTIPANDAAVGAVYEIDIWGNGQQGSTKQSLGLQVVLGGNNLASITFGTGSFQTASNLFRFRVVGRAICHTTGAGGTWTTLIYAQVSDLDGGAGSNPISPGNANFATAVSCESTGTQALDTTAQQTVGVSAAWGSVTGAPTMTSRVAIFKRLC